jgi:hypothetical protein
MSLKLFAAANLALATAKPTASLMERQTQNPIASFDLGTKWEICIHKPIQHNSVDDLIPSEAMIWDIDQSHAKEYPETIDLLKVCRTIWLSRHTLLGLF